MPRGARVRFITAVYIRHPSYSLEYFIVTGRDRERLDRIARELPRLHVLQSDVTDTKSMTALTARVKSEFPALNVLINKAGIMRKINWQDRGLDLEDIGREIATNLPALVRMVTQSCRSCRRSRAPPSSMSRRAGRSRPFRGRRFMARPKRAFTRLRSAYACSSRIRRSKCSSWRRLRRARRDKMPSTKRTSEARPSWTSMSWFAKPSKEWSAINLEILPGMRKVLRFMRRVAPGFMVKALSGSIDAMLAQTKLLPASGAPES